MNYAVRFYLHDKLLRVFYGLRKDGETLSQHAREAIHYVRKHETCSFDRVEIDSYYGEESYIRIILQEEFNFVFRIEDDL